MRPITAVLVVSLLTFAPAAISSQAAASAQPQPLPRGFRSVSLGMGLEQVKQALRSDPLFLYRGDPDVSFLPQTHQYLIECAGASFLRRAYFQFKDERLYIMILMLDPLKLDHYSLFSAFSAKYGPPANLSPQESVWESDAVRFSLERPLTVKYIDRSAFNAGLEAGKAPQDLEKLSREKFIEQF